MKRIHQFAVLPLALVTAACASAGAGAPAGRTATTSGPVQISYETYQLPNGLSVVLSRDASVPVVAVNLWYHVGSANELPGRTGFAHLFEHMLFQGSQNVGDDQHFGLIQEAGGTLNGSTNADRTNYFQAVPSNFLELLLWLESDRMGFLLPAMDQVKLDNQRAVVQNERRQRYENAPYGLAFETLAAALYPEGHPYSWTTIGSMADLNAASLEDVEHFFRTYYVPNNAFLSIVGDFDAGEARRLVERYFGGIPRGPEIERPAPARPRIEQPRTLVLEDRVQLPRLYMAWLTPALYEEGDAELDVLGRVLASGRTSRLYRRLVYEEQIAQFVFAGQSSRPLSGQFGITIQARPGVTLERIREVVDEEISRLRTEPPTAREVQQAVNNIEAGFIQRFQTNLGKADALNLYATYTGDPGFVEHDLARYARVTPASVAAAAERHLSQPRVMLSVVPQGRTHLAVE